MNLQQHYDLIGQILKERPELAELPVFKQYPCGTDTGEYASDFSEQVEIDDVSETDRGVILS